MKHTRSTALEAFLADRLQQAVDRTGLEYLNSVFVVCGQARKGSWHVKPRALALQPYFKVDFPHGFDPWISAAATSSDDTSICPPVPPRYLADEVKSLDRFRQTANLEPYQMPTRHPSPRARKLRGGRKHQSQTTWKSRRKRRHRIPITMPINRRSKPAKRGSRCTE